MPLHLVVAGHSDLSCHGRRGTWHISTKIDHRPIWVPWVGLGPHHMKVDVQGPEDLAEGWFFKYGGIGISTVGGLNEGICQCPIPCSIALTIDSLYPVRSLVLFRASIEEDIRRRSL